MCARRVDAHAPNCQQACEVSTEVCDVSCQLPLIDDAPGRRFRIPEDTLGNRLHTITELGDHHRELVRFTRLEARL